MPKISVIMSIYNESLDWAKQAIDSILNQTYSNFEFIIINDKPDRVENRKLLEEYSQKDSRIIVLNNEINIGLTKSLNRGLEVAKGLYIARMDADDISYCHRFQVQIDFLEKNVDCDMCISNYTVVDENLSVIMESALSNFSENDLFMRDVIAHPSVMFRASLKRMRYPLYNEDFRNAQDYELWVTMLLNGKKIGYVPQINLLYRKSSSQISSCQNILQLDNGRKIRRKLITGYLKKYNITVDDCTKVDEILHMVKQLASKYKDKKLENIKYILYYTLSETNFMYAIRYLFDCDILLVKMSIKHSCYVLFASLIKNRWVLYRY